jgi:sucrose phosphorylase
MQNGDDSSYKDMFIDWNKFLAEWRTDRSGADVCTAVRRKARFSRLTPRMERRSTSEHIFSGTWTSIRSAKPRRSTIAANLGLLAKHVPLIRFDAFAYASKSRATSCFFVEPEIWDVLETGMKPCTRAAPRCCRDSRKLLHPTQDGGKSYWSTILRCRCSCCTAS